MFVPASTRNTTLLMSSPASLAGRYICSLKTSRPKSRTGQVEVPGDADHGQPGCARSLADAELRSQCVSIWPEPPRERFIDDELSRRVGTCGIERSSLQQAHTRHAKVSGSDERRFAELQIDRLRARRSFDGERPPSYRCRQ